MNSNQIQDHPEEPFLRFRDEYSRGPQFFTPGDDIEMLDGLPGYPFDQSLTQGANSNLSTDTGNISNQPSLAVQPPQMEWMEGCPSQLGFPFPGYYSDPPQINTSGKSQGFIGKPDTMLSSYDNVMPQSHGSTVPFRIAEAPNLRSQLLPESVKPYYWNYTACSGPAGYQTRADTKGVTDSRVGNTLGMESQLESASPYAFENTPPVTDLSSSKSSEDGEVDEVISAYGERSSDEPYAKLIYRALIGAPSHSMNLQDIYQWFLDNTDKGSLTSAGWRNSIRHNLSMNAAFRKTERPPVGDETKKNSAWVLEPFAIEHGVTPTTRYRKTGKKTMRSNNPAPARVRSGRAGGLSAGKTKYQRQKPRRERQEAPIESPSDYCTDQWRFEKPTPTMMYYNTQSPSSPIKHEFAGLAVGTQYNPYASSTPYNYHQLAILNNPKASLEVPWTFQDVGGMHLDDEPLFYKADPDYFVGSQSQLWAGPKY